MTIFINARCQKFTRSPKEPETVFTIWLVNRLPQEIDFLTQSVSS